MAFVGQGLAQASQVPTFPVQLDRVDDVQLLQDSRGTRTVAQVGFAGSIPADLEADFTHRFRASCEAFLQEYRVTFHHGSFLVYLEGQEMDDKEKKRVLQALMLIAHNTTEQLGLPQLGSPTLQIGNSLYSLSASGHLDKHDCKQQPRLLSAWAVEDEVVEHPLTVFSKQHSVSSRWHYLVALAADASLGDQLRLHFEDGSRTVTMEAGFDEPASIQHLASGQAVQLTILIPHDSKRVVAVELLRNSFASRRVGVRYPPCSKHRHAWQRMLMDPHLGVAGISLPATSQCNGTGRAAMLILLSAIPVPFELFYCDSRACLQCYNVTTISLPAKPSLQ